MASGGQISGCGLAKANTIGSAFMVLSMSTLKTFGPDKPKKMSRPFTASANTR